MVLMSLYDRTSFSFLFFKLILILSDSYLRNELCSCGGAKPLATTRGANKWYCTIDGWSLTLNYLPFGFNNRIASSNSMLDFFSLKGPLRSISLFYRPCSNNYLHFLLSRSLIYPSLLWWLTVLVWDYPGFSIEIPHHEIHLSTWQTRMLGYPTIGFHLSVYV